MIALWANVATGGSRRVDLRLPSHLIIQSPFQHLQPATPVQFGLGAVLQYSNTPSLRVAGFEDEDDDEDEDEGPCEMQRELMLVEDSVAR
jgi:hypothetical protein